MSSRDWADKPVLSQDVGFLVIHEQVVTVRGSWRYMNKWLVCGVLGDTWTSHRAGFSVIHEQVTMQGSWWYMNKWLACGVLGDTWTSHHAGLLMIHEQQVVSMRGSWWYRLLAVTQRQRLSTPLLISDRYKAATLASLLPFRPLGMDRWVSQCGSPVPQARQDVADPRFLCHEEPLWSGCRRAQGAS